MKKEIVVDTSYLIMLLKEKKLDTLVRKYAPYMLDLTLYEYLRGIYYLGRNAKKAKEYLEKKKAFVNKLIKKAERIIPGLSKHIIVIDAATPKTFEEYTFMPEGAIYAFDQSIDTKRPVFKTPIKGLYLASASTFPGGGIEAVVISGNICANDICGWKIPK